MDKPARGRHSPTPFCPENRRLCLSLRRSSRIWLMLALLPAVAALPAIPANRAEAQTTTVAATTTTDFKLVDLPQPPIDSKEKFVAYMVEKRHEDPKMLAWRF